MYVYIYIYIFSRMIEMERFALSTTLHDDVRITSALTEHIRLMYNRVQIDR